MGKFDIKGFEDEFRREIQSALESGGPVLDIGCGKEFGENQLEAYQISVPKNIDYLTLDVRPEPCPDLVADLSRLPINDSELSVVFVESVIEHVSPVSKVDDCMAEVHRALAKDGLVTGWVPFCYYFHGNGFPDGNRFTFDGVERMLDDFDQVAIQPCGGPASIFLNSLGGAAKRLRRAGVQTLETRLRFFIFESLFSGNGDFQRRKINSVGFRFFAKK